MKVYKTEDIRNVALLGHGGAGKTTVAEALAFVTGITSRMGNVTDGNTISDFDKEEKKRKFSISTSVIPIEYKEGKSGIKVNILDTPGFFDFVGEAEEAVSVADAAIIVVNCKAGIEPGTVKAWELCEKLKLPRMFFATNMDDEHASFAQLHQDLEARFGKSVVPFQLPIRENEKFVGYVDVISMDGHKFTNKNQSESCAVPAGLQDELETTRHAFLETVAETSDEFMEKFFAEEEFTPEEIQTAIREEFRTCGMVPVMMGSGLNVAGFQNLLQAIQKYMPSPAAFAIPGKQGEEAVSVNCDAGGAMSAVVWKTIVDPFMGKYSLVKVCTGKLLPNVELYNVNKEVAERGGKVYVLRGAESIEIPELAAGDIGAVAKLSVTETGDTLGAKSQKVLYDGPQLSTPYTYMAYRAENKADEDKLSTALGRMTDEDKTLRVVPDPENRQALLYGIGDQQLDVVASKVKERYNAGIILEKPKFAYRETIRKVANVHGRHKKQSGGHGQFGDVVMDFGPSGDNETAYIFEEKVFGGSVPKNYFPAVEKGVQDCCKKGPLAGYPVVGLKATLLDGSYHPVDSSEQAFKMAATIAFKDAFMKANPVILEPIANLKVTVPDANTGDIMGDLTKRRGRVLGMNALHNGKQMIEAEIPMSSLYGYNTDLRSMTGGAGVYEYAFVRYEQAPAEVQAQIVAEAEANAKED